MIIKLLSAWKTATYEKRAFSKNPDIILFYPSFLKVIVLKFNSNDILRIYLYEVKLQLNCKKYSHNFLVCYSKARTFFINFSYSLSN